LTLVSIYESPSVAPPPRFVPTHLDRRGSTGDSIDYKEVLPMFVSRQLRALIAPAIIAAMFGVPQTQAQGPGASPPSQALSAPAQVIASAATEGKLAYVMFYNQSDAKTSTLFETIKATSAKQPSTTWATVRVNDPNERPVAERFQVTRAPMPMVVAVHPNGAVTGFFAMKATEPELLNCLVSPKKAECMKALQTNQLVLVCVSANGQSSVPAGVEAFQTDPHFGLRTHVVHVNSSDPTEASFVAGMELDPRMSDTVTVFLAPPGAVVGKFPVNATKEQFAAKLAAAGKCCDDEKCQHNKAAPKSTARPGKVTQ